MKKAMVVLAVLAMAVSGCNTGLQDEIDDLKNKNKELEQQLAEQKELVRQITQQKNDAETEKGKLDKKIEALDLALAADTDAKIDAAKTALIAAGYTPAEADEFLSNTVALKAAKTTAETERDQKVQEIATLNQTIAGLQSQVPVGQHLQAQKALEWIQSPDRRYDGQELSEGDRRSMRNSLLRRIYDNGMNMEDAVQFIKDDYLANTNKIIT